MKRKLGIISGLTGIAVAAVSTVGTANAQSPAYTTQFTTSITYMNVGAAAANVTLNFYNENTGTAIPISRPQLNAGAGTSVSIGSLTEVGAGFKGSAVMSADQPVVATMVQVPQSTTVRNRPLANGFSSGSPKYLIATVLKNQFNSTTKFSVQNVDSEAVSLSVSFFNADNPAATPIVKTADNVAPGASVYFDAGTIGDLGDRFNGSATVTATKAGGAPGNIVAAAMELSTNGTGASSFEGVTEGGETFYMPSALCNFSGQSTAYAVQNTGADGAAPAVVTVTYSSGKTEQKTINVGAKASFLGCGDSKTLNPAGFSGSATLTATGNKIVAIGKVTGAGLSTAFLGARQGFSKLALPYVRWTNSRYDINSGYRQRTYIAIQNVGGAALPEGSVKIRYLDKNGQQVGELPLPAIPASGKVSTNPSLIGAAGNELGYYADNSFGASAIVEGPAGSQLVVVARVQSKDVNGQVGEDYNGVPVQ